MEQPPELPGNQDARGDPDERGLWFQYLSRLNDRNLESKRAVQPTTWVLFGLAAAILYKSIPLVPTWLALPDSTQHTGTILFLEADSLIPAMVALVFVMAYCGHGSEGRVVPEQGKRIFWVFLAQCLLTLLVLASSQFCLAYGLSGQPFVRRILYFYGALWGLIAIMIVVSVSRQIREGQKFKFQVPFFSYSPTPKWPVALSGVLASLILATIPLFGFFAYMRRLAGAQMEWLIELSAATQALLLGIVGFVLLTRAWTQASMEIYLQLEREIVMNTLPLDEIKIRFVTQALGASVTEWFQDLNRKFIEHEGKFKEICEVTRERLTEVEGVELKYPLERKGRAQGLLKEFDAALNEQTTGIRAILRQVHQFTSTSRPSHAEKTLIGSLVEDWDRRADNMLENAKVVRDIRLRLQTILNSEAPLEQA